MNSTDSASSLDEVEQLGSHTAFPLAFLRKETDHENEHPGNTSCTVDKGVSLDDHFDIDLDGSVHSCPVAMRSGAVDLMPRTEDSRNDSDGDIDEAKDEGPDQELGAVSEDELDVISNYAVDEIALDTFEDRHGRPYPNGREHSLVFPNLQRRLGEGSKGPQQFDGDLAFHFVNPRLRSIDHGQHRFDMDDLEPDELSFMETAARVLKEGDLASGRGAPLYSTVSGSNPSPVVSRAGSLASGTLLSRSSATGTSSQYARLMTSHSSSSREDSSTTSPSQGRLRKMKGPGRPRKSAAHRFS